mmetsp:Transcript_13119/g.24134  ORF Transcript_13119/g.24134 Transcript_13119/m.24134 type:complete len:295 (-) Transcript_13119:619-1503(-)
MTGMMTLPLEAVMTTRGSVVLLEPSSPMSKELLISHISSPREIPPTPVDKTMVCYFAVENNQKSNRFIALSLARHPNGAPSSTISQKNWKKRMACSINPLRSVTLVLFRPKRSTKTTNSSRVPRSINWAFKTSSALPCYEDTCTDSSSMSVYTIVSGPLPSHLNTTSIEHKRSKNGWRRSVPRESLPRSTTPKRSRQRSTPILPNAFKPRPELERRLVRLQRHWSKMIGLEDSLTTQTLKLIKRPWTSSCVIRVAFRQRRGVIMTEIWIVIVIRTRRMMRRLVVEQEEVDSVEL